jgi:hypothetical protein
MLLLNIITIGLDTNNSNLQGSSPQFMGDVYYVVG